jgi:hypothetical protein
MEFQGALVKEQGVTFAIVIVKRRVLDNKGKANRMIGAAQPIFPGVPIVLMAQDFRGRPTYYGRKDIVRFLAKVPVSAIPWREYTLT